MLENARTSTALAMLGSALFACTSPPAGGTDAGADAGIDGSGPVVQLEIGTGAESFEPFEDGATLDLVTGCQGSQHVWTSLRAIGLVDERAIVTLDLVRERDDARVGQLLLRIDFTPIADGSEIVGMTLVVPEPERALEEELSMRAHVVDTAEAEVEVVRPIRIAWGPDGCPGHG